MRSRSRRASLLFAVVAGFATVGTVAAADPSPPPVPPGQQKNAEKNAEKGPEVAFTGSGQVTASEDGQGRPEYTITVSGKTWTLSAGPKWFWGTDSPLAAYVGKTVDVVGTSREGSTEVDVTTVNGTAIREEGRPPWAGGPFRVGEKHPGWKARGAHPGRELGRELAPGQAKKNQANPETE